MPDAAQHRLDLSGVNNPDMVTEEAQAILEQIIRERSYTENKLTFLSLSAKRTDAGGLETTFILTNATADDMVIQKIPINFYDATGKLTAQGTFKLANVTLQSNTSKPITLVFPKEGILEDEMDLSSSSMELAAK